MTPPPTPPPNGPPGLPPFAVAGLSHGRVRVSARPAHGPADVERIARVLQRLRGLRGVEYVQQRGDVADFVVDLGRPVAMAADLKAAFGKVLLSCVRTADGFVLELEPTPGDPAPAPSNVRAPLGVRHVAPTAGGEPAPVVAPAALPARPIDAAPPAPTAEVAPRGRGRGDRRQAAGRVSDGLAQDRRCAVLMVDRDLVIRSAAGGLFRAFADDDRPLVGRPIGAAVTPVLNPLMVDHLTAAFRGEPTEVAIRSPRGGRTFELRFHPPRSRGLSAQCAVVAVDVTDEQEAADVARELDAVLDATVASSFVPTAMTDADGRWLRVNPPFEALLGHRGPTLTGRLASDLTQIDDRSREAYLRDQAIRSGEPSFELEKRMVRSDGAVIVVIARTAIVREGDDVRGFVVHLVPEDVAAGLPRPAAPPAERPRRRGLRRIKRGAGEEPDAAPESAG